jgi:DNA-binding transcriptional ArsR family regulator
MKDKKDLEKILKVLANRRRLAIIKYLKDTRGAPVGEIAGEINLSFRSTSKHLSILFSANLVDKDSKRTQVFYKLSDDYNIIIKQIVSAL